MSEFSSKDLPKDLAATNSSSSAASVEAKKLKPHLKIDNMPTPRIYMKTDAGKPGSILVKNESSSDIHLPVGSIPDPNAASTCSLSLLDVAKEATHKKSPSVHAHFLEGEEIAGLRSRSGSGSDRALDAENHPRSVFAKETAADKSLVPTSSGSSIERISSPDRKAPSSTTSAPGSGTSSAPVASAGDPRLPQDDGKLHILLGATGSISTGKLREIIVKLSDIYGKDKVSIQIILTKAAEHFVSRGEIPSSCRIWRDSDEWSTWRSRTDPVVHIELRRWADILVICPLSANTLGKIALGLCDNLLTNVVRAWNTQYPVLIAPAMLSYAYNHPATKRHLKVIHEDMKWIEVLKPVEKVVGSYGDIGMGGMMDWIQIVDKVVMKLGGYPEDEDEEDDDEGEDEDTSKGEQAVDEEEDGQKVEVNTKPSSETAVEDDEDLGVQGLSLAEQENYEKTHKKLRSSKSFS